MLGLLGVNFGLILLFNVDRCFFPSSSQQPLQPEPEPHYGHTGCIDVPDKVSKLYSQRSLLVLEVDTSEQNGNRTVTSNYINFKILLINIYYWWCWCWERMPINSMAVELLPAVENGYFLFRSLIFTGV